MFAFHISLLHCQTCLLPIIWSCQFVKKKGLNSTRYVGQPYNNIHTHDKKKKHNNLIAHGQIGAIFPSVYISCIKFDRKKRDCLRKHSIFYVRVQTESEARPKLLNVCWHFVSTSMHKWKKQIYRYKKHVLCDFLTKYGYFCFISILSPKLLSRPGRQTASSQHEGNFLMTGRLEWFWNMYRPQYLTTLLT